MQIIRSEGNLSFLENFLDCVGQDVLMSRLPRWMEDKWMLRII
jgi:hypothetical protein